MYKKDFKRWHGKKLEIDDIKDRPFFHEREIWFCYLGTNVGFEQDGSPEHFLRPIVILKKFTNEIFWGIPLTRPKKNKKVSKNSLKYYFSSSFDKGVESLAILSQIKLIDAKRLATHIGVMSEADFSSLRQKIKELIP